MIREESSYYDLLFFATAHQCFVVADGSRGNLLPLKSTLCAEVQEEWSSWQENYVVVRVQNLIQRKRHVTCRLMSSHPHNPIARKKKQELTHMLTTKSANTKHS